jgi:hypothetical protein
VSAEEDSVVGESTQFAGRFAQVGAIGGCAGGGWRAIWFTLAKREIAAQHPDSEFGERHSRGFEERSSRIAAGAMRQDETIASSVGRPMEKSTHGASGIGDNFLIRYTGEFGFGHTAANLSYIAALKPAWAA